MGEHPLIAIRAKIDRADEHLRTLKSERQQWQRDEPLIVRLEVDFKSGWHTAYIEQGRPMPPRFSILVGESLYQGRSALEHLVWALVKANHKKPGQFHSFPIRKEAVGTKGRSDAQAFIRKTQGCELAGVQVAAITLIESLQPYRTTNPTDHFLTRLNEMARDDRHHAIHGGFIGGDPMEIRSLFTARRGSRIVGFRALLTENGNLAVDRTNIARLRILPLSRKAKVDVHGGLTPRIAFGERSRFVLFEDFEALNAELRQIVGLFEEFL